MASLAAVASCAIAAPIARASASAPSLPRSGLSAACPLGLTRGHAFRPSASPRTPSSPTRRGQPVRAVVIESLPKEFGLVVLTAASSVVLTQWQMIQVAKQRRESNVPYPKMYEDKDDSVFNCYQRAHQNTLENYPSFLALLLLSGYAYPITASVCGMVWVVGRVFYSLGYYSGNPRNRLQGAWGTFGLLGLLVAAGVFGVRQLL